jgi:mRNA interferase MazF
MAAKVRPCVVVSISQPDRQRNMSVVVPMTTEIRGGECEIQFPKPAWLRQESVVNVLGIAGVDNARIERRLAAFPADKMLEIEAVLKRVLGF